MCDRHSRKRKKKSTLQLSQVRKLNELLSKLESQRRAAKPFCFNFFLLLAPRSLSLLSSSSPLPFSLYVEYNTWVPSESSKTRRKVLHGLLADGCHEIVPFGLFAAAHETKLSLFYFGGTVDERESSRIVKNLVMAWAWEKSETRIVRWSDLWMFQGEN